MIRSEIICDGCGIKGVADFYRYNRWLAHIGRNEIHEQGWKVGEPHGKDYCPKWVTNDSGPKELVFHWKKADGQSCQLDLPLYDDSVQPLLAVSRMFGDTAVRDLLTIYLLAWGQGGKPDGIWWWPDEHLELCGLSNSKDNRKALLSRFAKLQNTQLVAHYKDGPSLKGPLLSAPFSHGTARRVTLHPALYCGVRFPENDAGKRTWVKDYCPKCVAEEAGDCGWMARQGSMTEKEPGRT